MTESDVFFFLIGSIFSLFSYHMFQWLIKQGPVEMRGVDK